MGRRLTKADGGNGAMRILIAEDEMLVALELEDLLTELDYDVIDVVSSVDGILSGLEGADCALLDINLKGENCYRAALVLQERKVPFAFVTGYADLPDCPSRLDSVPRLGKPFNKALLATLLQRLDQSRILIS